MPVRRVSGQVFVIVSPMCCVSREELLSAILESSENGIIGARGGPQSAGRIVDGSSSRQTAAPAKFAAMTRPASSCLRAGPAARAARSAVWRPCIDAILHGRPRAGARARLAGAITGPLSRCAASRRRGHDLRRCHGAETRKPALQTMRRHSRARLAGSAPPARRSPRVSRQKLQVTA